MDGLIKCIQSTGHDGKLSYGGACFPKDSKALFKFLQDQNLPNKVLKSTIERENLLEKKFR